MRGALLYPLLFFATYLDAQQFYVQPNATVQITSGANLEIGGNLENDGVILNTGTLSLFGDWLINNNYNGIGGNLVMKGNRNQRILNQQFVVNKFIMNSGGEITYEGEELRVLDEINFIDGVLITGENTRFILESNGRSLGGSPRSYVQGKMTHLGGGSKFFPLGYEGQYAPLTLLDVVGVDQALTATYQNPNPSTPVPGEDLLGVSHLGLWEVSLDQGSIDSAIVSIDFSNEDLENFLIRNDIRHRINSPVVAFSDSVDGTFNSLGVETLNSTDSMTFGSLTTEIGILPVLNESIYLAMALAPRIVPEGQVYIPQAFSPRASDRDNQTFRVFGERIKETDFTLEIYNRLGILVYSTNSFEEANKTGWTGVNQKTGKEEPSGTYYYFVRLMKENEEIIEEKGALYLLR